MTFNASERKDVRAAEKAAKAAESSRLEVIKAIMTQAGGRAWMLERLTRSHVFSSSFAPDALAMAFAEGERNIGLQDLNDVMQACPQSYILMMEEHNARSNAADARYSNTNGRDNRPEPEDGSDPERAGDNPAEGSEGRA